MKNVIRSKLGWFLVSVFFSRSALHPGNFNPDPLPGSFHPDPHPGHFHPDPHPGYFHPDPQQGRK